MRYGERDVKIGIADSPRARFRALRADGAAEVVRAWDVAAADARAVEARAHRLLADYRHRIAGQRERFAVPVAAAIRAVDLAILLVAEDRAEAARRADLREAMTDVMRDMVPLPAEAGWPIGYVLQPSARAASLECDLLAAAGVDPARLLVDVGQRPGRGLRRAIEMCGRGDVLVVAEEGRIGRSHLTALAGRGATLHVLLPGERSK